MSRATLIQRLRRCRRWRFASLTMRTLERRLADAREGTRRARSCNQSELKFIRWQLTNGNTRKSSLSSCRRFFSTARLRAVTSGGRGRGRVAFLVPLLRGVAGFDMCIGWFSGILITNEGDSGKVEELR